MPPAFFRVASTHIFSGWQLEKSWVSYRKKIGEHPKKILVDATLEKSQVAAYKNLGRFYRVSFKSLLKVKIKQVNVFQKKST